MTSKHAYNLPAYRKALARVKTGKLGVYPKVDKKGRLEFYLLHTNLDKMRFVCMNYAKCRCSFIRRKCRKGSPSKFFYVKLVDIYSDKWLKYVKHEEDWKKI